MSRWILTTLIVVAGMLVWTIAAWPVSQDASTVEETTSAEATDVPVAMAAAEPVVAPPPSAATAATARPPSPEPGEAFDPEPAPAPTAAPPVVDPAAAEAEANRFFTRENGPLAEYKAAFAGEQRDSQAVDVEEAVRDAFHPNDSTVPVFRAVLCHETICKVETRFGPENMGAYIAAMTRMVGGKFDAQLATERTSLIEAGEISVTVYAKRPQLAANP